MSEPVFVHTVFDGRVFVPTQPVDLPAGSTLDGVVKRPLANEEWLALLDQLHGSWSDFDFVEPEELPMDEEEPSF